MNKLITAFVATGFAAAFLAFAWQVWLLSQDTAAIYDMLQ